MEGLLRRLAGEAASACLFMLTSLLMTESTLRSLSITNVLRFTGVIAWLMWLALHLIYITGFKSRITALLHWAVSFIGRGRSERTATEQQIFGRQALTRLEGGAAGLVTNVDGLDGPDPSIAERRRQELEERALAEMRLTDSGERGQPPRL